MGEGKEESRMIPENCMDAAGLGWGEEDYEWRRKSGEYSRCLCKVGTVVIFHKNWDPVR